MATVDVAWPAAAATAFRPLRTISRCNPSSANRTPTYATPLTSSPERRSARSEATGEEYVMRIHDDDDDSGSSSPPPPDSDSWKVI